MNTEGYQGCSQLIVRPIEPPLTACWTDSTLYERLANKSSLKCNALFELI